MKELGTEKLSKFPMALELELDPKESGSQAYEFNHCASCLLNTRSKITKIISVEFSLVCQFPAPISTFILIVTILNLD